MKLKYLVIHTADTPYDRDIIEDDIVLWHMGACKNSNGTYTFKGKTLQKSELTKAVLKLPSGKTITADKTNGRGWTKPGYSDFVKRNGMIVNIMPYNWDDNVDPWEVTNGVAGKNSVSRHICLAGGWSKDGTIKNGQTKNGYMKIEDLYTEAQIKSLVYWLKKQLEHYPDIIVCGHNQLASKTCPNFNVNEFLDKYGIKCNRLPNP